MAVVRVTLNYLGHWCSGCMINIGVCSAADAELWVVIHRLSLAWRFGIKKLILKVDSLLVINQLKKVSACDSNQVNLIQVCLDFLRRDYEVKISHIYREDNQLADYLANKALHIERGIQVLNNALTEVLQFLRNDMVGVAWGRYVKEKTN